MGVGLVEVGVDFELANKSPMSSSSNNEDFLVVAVVVVAFVVAVELLAVGSSYMWGKEYVRECKG